MEGHGDTYTFIKRTLQIVQIIIKRSLIKETGNVLGEPPSILFADIVTNEDMMSKEFCFYKLFS